MSEPCSLVMEASLTEPELEAFLSSPLRPVHWYADWALLGRQYRAAWLDRVDHTEYPDVRSWLAGTAESAWEDGFPAENQVWRHHVRESRFVYLSILFSENFIQYLDALNVLRGVAEFQTSPQPGMILIYPYFWGHPDFVSAAVELGPGSSRLLDREREPARVREFRRRADILLKTRLAELGVARQAC